MKRILLLCTFAAVCLGGPKDAEHSAAILDKNKTHVTWELGGNMHTTHGTFHLKEGTISLNFDQRTMGGQVVIDAKSGESGNSSRDRRMHAEVLETEKYPEIRFTPVSWQGDVAMTGKSTVQVIGLLEMHGAKHEVMVPVELSIDQGHFTGTMKFDVPYVQWGMKDPSNFLFRVDKKVAIEVAAEGELGDAR